MFTRMMSGGTSKKDLMGRAEALLQKVGLNGMTNQGSKRAFRRHAKTCGYRPRISAGPGLNLL